MRDTRPRRHGTALAQDGWKVDVVCARDRGEPLAETSEGVHIWRIPTRRRGGSAGRRIFEYCAFALAAFFVVTALWLARRHRLVYVLGMPNFIVLCALVPRALRRHVVLDMRDPFPEFFLAKYEGSANHPLFRFLLLEEKISSRFASSVLAAAPSMAELYERSVPRERVSIVWNSVDPRLFTAPGARTRSSDRTLLYTGTVTHPYGVDLAVQAVARLHRDVPGLRIKIVGDGDLLGRIEQMARAEGITELVELHPPIPLQKVPGIIVTAWLGVQPIRPSPLMEHSLSTKILEWCHMGLPVAAGRTPPLTELFGDNEILFHEPGDLDGLCARVLEAHADPAGLADRAERARKALDRIRFEDQIEAFLQTAEGGSSEGGSSSR